MSNIADDPRCHAGKLVGLEFELETTDGASSDKTTLTIEVTAGNWGPMPVTVLTGRWRLGGGGEGLIITLIEDRS